jgi:DNA end-binding protein Ku
MTLSIPSDDSLPGMMAYTLRFEEELRSASDFFSGIKKTSVDADQLALAKELIKGNTGKFDMDRYKDEYEAALRELVDAKLKHVAPPQAEKRGKPGKVINLMDALRKSVSSPTEQKPARSTGGKEVNAKHRLHVVGSASKAPKHRKSA